MTAVLPEFRLVRPGDVASAIAARRDHRTARFLAGGTDLIVNLRNGLDSPELLIDLTGIDGFAGMTTTDQGLRIGACVPLSRIAEASDLRRHYRAVAEAAEAIAAPAHRAAGTVGGNLCLDTRCIYYNQSQWWRRANGFCLKHHGEICHVAPQGKRCHAAFCGDLAAALIAIRAEAEIAGPGGRRRLPLTDLYVEDGKAHLALAPGELVVAVHLAHSPPPSAYEKIRVRDAVDFPLAGIAVALGAANGVITSLRVGLTGTNSWPFLLAGTDALIGQPANDRVLREIDKLVQKQVQPMRTTITSPHYRRLAAAALAQRLVTRLFAEQEEAA